MLFSHFVIKLNYRQRQIGCIVSTNLLNIGNGHLIYFLSLNLCAPRFLLAIMSSIFSTQEMLYELTVTLVGTKVTDCKGMILRKISITFISCCSLAVLQNSYHQDIFHFQYRQAELTLMQVDEHALTSDPHPESNRRAAEMREKGKRRNQFCHLLHIRSSSPSINTQMFTFRQFEH